jgi:hypothetical protein
MKTLQSLTSCLRVNRIRALRTIGVVMLTVAGTGMSQPSVPIGTTRPAEYDCSGLEGVALRNCLQLNAAAIVEASGKSDTPDSTYDCADMSGAALLICRDLNAHWVAPGTGQNSGSISGFGAAGATAPNAGGAPLSRPMGGAATDASGSGGIESTVAPAPPPAR